MIDFPMRILLIDGNGFIGRFAVAALAQQGHALAVFHRGTTAAPAGVDEIRGDRHQLNASAKELKRFAPDVVIDLVASSGPHMMTGYRNRSEETARTIRDGFIYTGDIGYLDEDGFVFITDRKKDVVFVKGFNVFPREVEDVISAHAKVGMVAVVGPPDSRSGDERLVAFIVPRAGEMVDEAEISLALLVAVGQLQVPERGADGWATSYDGRS